MTNNNIASSPDQGNDPLAIPSFLDRRHRIVAASCIPARSVARVSAAGAAVVAFPQPSRPLVPDGESMSRHILELFGAATEGLIELAWIEKGRGSGARLFAIDNIEALVEQAVAWNKGGRNLYIGATLKHPHTAPFGRTSDSDAFSCWAYWLDIDDAGAVERAEAATRQFPPTVRITTGTVPQVRQHWWWRLDAAVMDMEAVRERIAKFARQFGGDTSVHNPGRIMRLGGSIAWPTKPGRVAQLVTVTTTGRAYSNDEIDYHAGQVTAPTRIETPVAPMPVASAPSVSGSLGVLPAPIEDGREGYMRSTIAAVLREFIGTHGAAPTEAELYDAAWPQYDRKVDWRSRPGRGPDEFRQKVALTLRRFHGGRIKGLRNEEEAVASHEARRRSDPVHRPGSQPHDTADGDWTCELVRASNGRPYFNMANALSVLRHHDDVRDLLAFDAFADRRLVMRAIPGSRRVASPYPRELDDDDLSEFTAWFSRNGFPLAGKNTVADAVGVIVREAVIHPVRAWLDGLAWDGVERLDHWLVEYLGAADTQFVRHAGACWLISAVARVMQPGCKADGVLILEGNQGIGKSSALRVLAGDWFGDALPPMTSKDASSYLRGSWIIELSELSAMNRSDIEAIKAFLSRSEERFRPAYGRYEVTVPRQCVFAGTTNQSSYLQDTTGNRRFWPVNVGDIDLKRLEGDRDQLFAEAVAAFREGRQWWLPAEIEALARTAQAERVVEDPWLAEISTFVAGRDQVAVNEIATQALSMDIKAVARTEQNRITGTLRGLGFERRGQFSAGRWKGCGKFVRTPGASMAPPADTEF